MKLTKKEQLREVFEKLLTQFAEELESEHFVGDLLIDSYAGILLKEVSMRFYIKGDKE